MLSFVFHVQFIAGMGVINVCVRGEAIVDLSRTTLNQR